MTAFIFCFIKSTCFQRNTVVVKSHKKKSQVILFVVSSRMLLLKGAGIFYLNNEKLKVLGLVPCTLPSSLLKLEFHECLHLPIEPIVVTGGLKFVQATE